MFTEKIAMIKIWLRQIISKIEYLAPSIYDFLEFDDATRICIMKDQRNKSNSLDQSNWYIKYFIIHITLYTCNNDKLHY